MFFGLRSLVSRSVSPSESRRHARLSPALRLSTADEIGGHGERRAMSDRYFGISSHGGGSSSFLSSCLNRPSCCMHAFYTQGQFFRNFSACSAIKKLAFCSAKERLMGVCTVGAQATTNACGSCLKIPSITMQTFKAGILCNKSYLQRFWACFKQ